MQWRWVHAAWLCTRVKRTYVYVQLIHSFAGRCRDMTRTIVLLTIAMLWATAAETQTLPRFEILPTAYGSNQGIGEYNAYKIDRSANKLFYCRAVVGGAKESATCKVLTTDGIPDLSRTHVAPVDPGEGNAG